MKRKGNTMKDEIVITALVETEPSGATRSAVLVARDGQLVQSAWLIGDFAVQCCANVAEQLKEAEPNRPQKHVGFKITSGEVQ